MATDKERLDAAANWIRQNQDKQGTPEWEKVTGAYKELRGSQSAAPEAPNPARVAADANAKKEWEQGGFGYDLVDATRQAAKGVPILGGLLDEGLASASSALGGDYEKSLEYQRARDRFREQLNPESSLALNLTGGIGSALLAAPAAGISNFGVNSASPLAQRALAGGAIGIPLGAADGFARGEGGVDERGADAAISGALGMVAGGIAPVIGQGVSSAYQGISNWLSRNASLQGLGLSRPVAEEIFDRFSADELGGRGLARIRQGGPDAMVADAGPNAVGMLDATIQKGGPGAQLASRAVEDRATAANQRLRGTLDQTLGAPEGVTARRTNIRTQSAAGRQQAYDAAYQAPIDYTTPEGQQIAALWARVRPNRRAAANALLEEGGHPPIADGALPDVRQLDYVTRALNDVAASGEGQGALGGVNATGRSAQELATRLRDAARAAVPEYDNALNVAADPIRRSQAVRLGSRLLDKQFTRADLMEELQGMTGPERTAALGGLRDKLDEIMANVRGMASDPNVDARQLNETVRSLTSEANRQKIGEILGNPQAAMRFFREVGQAARAAELRASVSTNSRTATRQETIRGMDERLRPGIVGTAMEGDIPGATKKAVAAMTGATQRQSRLRNNAQWEQLARALTERRGRAAELFLRQLQAAANARAANTATGRNLGIAAAGTVAGSQPTLRGAIPY
jgi:hypothetical protein